jgi:hypothetical protein
MENHMNAKTICFSLILFSIISCKKDSTVGPGDSNDNLNNPPIVSISVGNQYHIYYVEGSGIVVFDWYQTSSVLRDTTIAGNKYYVISSGEIIRSTASSVIQWSGSSENILYRFDVKIGDSTSYQGRQLKIESISSDTVFIGTQTIIEASNSSSNPDTTFIIRYATKFGLLYTRKSISNKSWVTSLAGAKIDTTKYGFM